MWRKRKRRKSKLRKKRVDVMDKPIVFVSFLHLGEKKCPKCGLIGDVIKGKKAEEASHKFNYYKCPGCETEFTNELILSIGEKEFDFRPN